VSTVVVTYASAVFCGIGLALFAAASAIRVGRRVRRGLERRRAVRRFLKAAADPEARVARFIGYGPADPTFHQRDNEGEQW
jgi:hypothetical protein